jgi:formylglycine-generating enzyme required for sulfatase activity
MTGNVLEWCWDGKGEYPSALETDPRGATSGTYRVIRGGSWNSYARNTRCAYRNHFWPYFASNYFGFRLARGQP